MPKLTKRFVEALNGRSKPYLISDGIIPDFYVRVMPSSKKSYYLQYRSKDGVKQRLLLGQHGVITAEQARDKAEAKRVEIKAGSDPQLEKTKKRNEPLMSDVAERFMNEHVLVRCKLRTQQEYRDYLRRRILPFFGNMKISEITRSDVASFQLSMQHIPCESNHCLAVVSKICNLAEIWGLRPEGANPCKHVKKFPIKSHDRYLSEEETKCLAKVLDEVKRYPDENLAAVYCIQLLLFTGCRLSEILTLKWEYVDYEKKLLRLPDSKTGAKIVYAGSIVMNVLEEIKCNSRRPQGNPYVIWGKKPNACLNNVQKPWRRFRKLAGLDNVRIHDLRHSFASFMVNEGTSLAMIGKLLGHTQVQTTERYSHVMTESLIATTERITSRLGRMFNVEVTEKNQVQEKNDTNFTAVEGTAIKAPVYLSSEQAAKYLSVKQSLMECWRYKKTGPTFHKVGGRVRYTLEALNEFLSAASKQDQLTRELS